MVKIQEPADSFCLLDEYLKFSSLLQQKMIATRAMPKGFSIQLFSRFGPAQRLKANGLLHMEEYKWRPIDERNRFGPTEPKSTGPSRSSSKPPATAELPQKSSPAAHPWPPAATCARAPTWGTSPRSPSLPLPHFPSSSRVLSSLVLPPLSRARRDACVVTRIGL
jgi:hypothetical protein